MSEIQSAGLAEIVLGTAIDHVSSIGILAASIQKEEKNQTYDTKAKSADTSWRDHRDYSSETKQTATHQSMSLFC